MRRLIMAGALVLVSSATLANQLYRPDVQVNVPPEVFNYSGQRAQPCSQCCIYQDKNYSEGAVIKADGVLLQCQRDDKTISTNPLVWRRVKG
ncbi:YnjH family protein [Citrobacter portucalensis]|uniref:YnjH family protein n=1 Tax=Citrobacter portucalensis TaxID=1639133 RepID=UPI002FE6699E